ncbi:PLD nuclease N-terminal domain-containing protein [Microbispora sp. H11081]|uniref:PLD nuclease N-terminal domain-containing protein n=1 Tax=Microbispora sp. H11081 TaxID=2729107 RepID=UPI0014734F64|nr:PLD nuclease N-terminal domain-containing protein [Microbispora sp. H11081]
MPSVIIGLALLALWLYCLFDVITTPAQDVRNLPKFLWVLIVVFLADIGALTWLLVGRPRREPAVHPAGAGGWARSGEAPRGPDDDPEFLRTLERRLRDED